MHMRSFRVEHPSEKRFDSLGSEFYVSHRSCWSLRTLVSLLTLGLATSLELSTGGLTKSHPTIG